MYIYIESLVNMLKYHKALERVRPLEDCLSQSITENERRRLEIQFSNLDKERAKYMLSVDKKASIQKKHNVVDLLLLSNQVEQSVIGGREK